MRTTLSIQQLIDQFIIEQDIATTSRAQYSKALVGFFLWCHRKGINQREVRREHIIQYKSELNTDGYSTLTIDFRLTCIRKFYTWADQLGYCVNPSVGIKNFKRYNGFRKDALTGDQVSTLMGTIHTDTIHGLRNKAIIFLMLANALREVEVCRMNMNDITMSNGLYIIRIQGKGKKSKDDSIVVEPQAFDAINDYLVKRKDTKPTDPLFSIHAFMRNNVRMRPQYVSEMISTYMVKAGVKSDRISPHSLRHTAAVFALMGGSSLYDVQLFLRHTNSSITEIYTRTIEKEIRRQNHPSKVLVNLITKNQNTMDNMASIQSLTPIR
jgi:integrase/recombinase XerD